MRRVGVSGGIWHSSDTIQIPTSINSDRLNSRAMACIAALSRPSGQQNGQGIAGTRPTGEHAECGETALHEQLWSPLDGIILCMRARILATAVLATVLATSAGSAQLPRDRTLPPFDFARWARFIVRDFFVVQPYEKVVIMADPSYYPELLDAIRAELLEAKAIELGTMLFDGEAMFARRSTVRPRASDPEFKKQSTAAARALYEKADIFLWLPYRYGTGSELGDWRELEHLVEGTHARGLHFHWIQGRQITQGAIEALSAIYAAALDIDYAALSAHQDRAIGVLKGREMRITTPLGTDLRVQVRQDSWFHKDDGRIDRARAAAARAVRDREMELPAGALRFVPDISTTEGRLVVDRWGGGQVVTFTFAQGRIVSVTAKTGQDAVAAAWTRQTGDKDRFAELVLGMNPKLPHEGPSGQLPYYGYGAGILRIALGDNWESGGANRSSLEAWFYLTDATITAGDVTLVKDGKLVLP
jgi:leucyl aminopeptidase (aminopeptidase T)